MMNFKEHLTQLKELLRPHTSFWSEEILNFYPHTLGHYPKEWLDSLDNLSKEDLWAFDNKKDYSKLPRNGLPELCQKLVEVTSRLDFKAIEEEKTPLKPKDFIKIKRKKKHEIIQIHHTLEKNLQKSEPLKNLTHFIDIGGGVGHLSRVISSSMDKKITSIDLNKEFQETGIKRNHPHITFLNHEMKEDSFQNEDIQKAFHDQSFCLGLHTCGPLANHLIKTSARLKAKGLFNFGCCYLKCDPKKDVHLSVFDRETGPLSYTNHALTLATRSHQEISFEDFLLKERVKNYRYGLHLFLYYELNIKGFVGVGEYPVKKYWEPFTTYARKKLNELGLKASTYSDQTLQNFHQNPEIQKKIRRMFLANIIRWQFGKAVEHALLTDRCLYLEEKGFQVEMAEYFNSNLSPRNIGILAQRA